MTSYVIGVLLIGVLFVLLLNYYNKYKKIKKTIKELYKPLRHGYYKIKYTITGDNITFESTVFVDELERYQSSESKIKLVDIECHVSETIIKHDTVRNRIMKDFKSLVKTSDINWLELEHDLMEDRKNKILKIIKNKKKL